MDTLLEQAQQLAPAEKTLKLKNDEAPSPETRAILVLSEIVFKYSSFACLSLNLFVDCFCVCSDCVAFDSEINPIESSRYSLKVALDSETFVEDVMDYLGFVLRNVILAEQSKILGIKGSEDCIS